MKEDHFRFVWAVLLVAILGSARARTDILDPFNTTITVGFASSLAGYATPSISIQNGVITYSNYSNVRLDVTGKFNEALDAIVAAANDINHGLTPYLSGYQIRLEFLDSQGDDRIATEQALKAASLELPIVLLPDENDPALATVNVLNSYKLVTLTVRDRTDKLNNQARFPWVPSTKQPASPSAKATAKAIKNIGWSNVILLTTTERVALDYSSAFIAAANNQNITVRNLITLLDPSDVKGQLAFLKESPYRLLVLSAIGPSKVQILAQAAEMGLMGDDSPYIWLAWGYCNEVALFPYANRTYIDGYLCINTHATKSQLQIDYETRLHSLIPQPNDASIYNCYRGQRAVDTYDGMMIVANALECFVNLKKRCINNGYLSTAVCPFANYTANEDALMLSCIMNSNTVGMGGNLTFDSATRSLADEFALTQAMWNHTTNKEDWSVKKVVARDLSGVYDVEAFRFADGTSTIPPDKAPVIVVIHSFSAGTAMAMQVLSGLVIVFAGFCIMFSVSYQKVAIIRLSAPRINIISAVGCIFFCVSVLLLSQDPVTTGSCQGLLWTLPIGFTLLFGGMFSKIWRIYTIFNQKLVKKHISDFYLLRLVIVLVGIDVLLVGLLTLPDAISPTAKVIQEDYFASGTVSHQRWTCTSTKSTWVLYALLIYKGILLGFGSFITFQTRNAHMEQILADSKWISMCIYSTTVIGMILVPIQFGIYDSLNGPQLGYVISSAGLVVVAAVNLCFLFVPKMLMIFIDREARKKFAAFFMENCGEQFGCEINVSSVHTTPNMSRANGSKLASIGPASGLGNNKPVSAILTIPASQLHNKENLIGTLAPASPHGPSTPRQITSKMGSKYEGDATPRGKHSPRNSQLGKHAESSSHPPTPTNNSAAPVCNCACHNKPPSPEQSPRRLSATALVLPAANKFAFENGNLNSSLSRYASHRVPPVATPAPPSITLSLSNPADLPSRSNEEAQSWKDLRGSTSTDAQQSAGQPAEATDGIPDPIPHELPNSITEGDLEMSIVRQPSVNSAVRQGGEIRINLGPSVSEEELPSPKADPPKPNEELDRNQAAASAENNESA